MRSLLSFCLAFSFVAPSLAIDIQHEKAFEELADFMEGVWTNDTHESGLRREHVYERTLSQQFVKNNAEQDPKAWHGYFGIHLGEKKLAWWGFQADGSAGAIFLTEHSSGRWKFEGDAAARTPHKRIIVIEKTGESELKADMTDTIAGVTTHIQETWVKHSLNTTREDFEEFCGALKGRWTSEIKIEGARQRYGSPGETATGHYSSHMSADGNVHVATFIIGDQTGKWIIYYDAPAKRTRILSVVSDGGIGDLVVYKLHGKFHTRSIGDDGAGQHRSGWGELTISNDGNTHTWTNRVEIDDKPAKSTTEVWQRISK